MAYDATYGVHAEWLRLQVRLGTNPRNRVEMMEAAEALDIGDTRRASELLRQVPGCKHLVRWLEQQKEHRESTSPLADPSRLPRI